MSHTYPRIFISYARKDGASLAVYLDRELRLKGFDVWLDTSGIASGLGWTEEVEKQIDQRDLTIAVLTRGSYISPICRAEQLRTLRKGKRLIPVLAELSADRPIYLEPLQYLDLSDPSQYGGQLERLFADIDSSATATLQHDYRHTKLRYITAPPRVRNYIDRDAAITALRDELLADSSSGPMALTGVAGMGGIGKTVLARAVSEDALVQEAFPDGIVWATIGKETAVDPVVVLREIGKALGDDTSYYENAIASRNRYKTLIGHKAVLIIIDDVWRTTDLEPFLAESPNSRLLFTTRDGRIVRFAGAREYLAGLMDEKQSRALLAAWAGLQPELLPRAAAVIIRQCGCLPLALATIGALLRGCTSDEWNAWAHTLENSDKDAVELQLPPGQANLVFIYQREEPVNSAC